MIEVKNKKIGGYTYHVQQFGARKGMRVGVRLMKMVGGAAGEAMKNNADFDMKTVGSMVANFADIVTEKDFDYLCDAFMSNTLVSGGEYGGQIKLNQEGIIDLHFAGNYPDMMKWLLFCIEVNFGSFLGEAGLLKKVIVRPDSAKSNGESQSKSPNISNQSGASGA